jgi:hypothetical protein
MLLKYLSSLLLVTNNLTSSNNTQVPHLTFCQRFIVVNSLYNVYLHIAYNTTYIQIWVAVYTLYFTIHSAFIKPTTRLFVLLLALYWR